MRKSPNRFRFPGLTLLVLSLAGCVPSQPVANHQGDKPQATAPALAAQPVQTAPPAPQPLSREEQKVRLLIQQVEQAYAFGETDYRKGNLVEAKVEFDRAVD